MLPRSILLSGLSLNGLSRSAHGDIAVQGRPTLDYQSSRPNVAAKDSGASQK